MTSKPLIVANWKMNPSEVEIATDLLQGVINELSDEEAKHVVICPPFVYLLSLHLVNDRIYIGAQDCFWEEAGAFTGEVSPSMLKNVGCSYVILGHSERKNYLQETTDIINKKVSAVIKAGLTPIICIGETEKGTAKSDGKIKEQMQAILAGIDGADIKLVVLVYEPEWAISTNENAEPAAPEDCKKAISAMREILSDMFDETAAKEITILYGGSADSTNIKDFLTHGQADGALVGGASLDAEEFVRLVKKAASV